ncbi:MAG: DUF1667 domain-containing protein [Clostridia bacterium]|nr:DUF1667 domain-containing protein [Clostridia bacterium]
MEKANEIRRFPCTVCPMGCELSVDTASLAVTGNGCPRGAAYGVAEVTHPTRTLTTTVALRGSDRVIAVRTDKPIPKELLLPAMDFIRAYAAPENVQPGAVLIEGFMGTDANLVVTGK